MYPMNSAAPPGVVAWDAILTMARDNNVAGVVELLEKGAPPSYCNRVGQTPLHIATMWGSVEAAKALIYALADPNAANKLRGSTPLHAAALGRGPVAKRAECVKLIIKGRGDPNKADLGGDRPMDMAADEEIRVALGAPALILHKAAEQRQMNALKQGLAQIGSGTVPLTLETTNPMGETALHTAAAWPEGLQALLEARSDVNAESNVRRSPLHMATLSGDLRTVQLLVNAQADVNIQDVDMDHDPRYSKKEGETPEQHRTALHYAAVQSNCSIVKVLLQAKASVDVRDSQQMTPLHHCLAASEEDDLEVACGVRVDGLQSRSEWNGRLGSILGPSVPTERSTVRWPVLLEGNQDGVMLKEENLSRVTLETLDSLLEARADVSLGNLQWGEGRTILHEAAHMGNVEATKRVLAWADVNCQDKQGFSALHLAVRARKAEVIRLLVKSRADLKQQTAAQKTSAELGAINGLSGELMSLLRGEAPQEASDDESPVSHPQTIAGMSAEQRAMLFID